MIGVKRKKGQAGFKNQLNIERKSQRLPGQTKSKKIKEQLVEKPTRIATRK